MKCLEHLSMPAQSCLTLCDPMDCSLSGSSVHGIFQARVLEWIAISFSRGSSWPRNLTWVSRIASRHFTVWATLQGSLYLLKRICKSRLENSYIITGPVSLFGPWGPSPLRYCFFSFLNKLVYSMVKTLDSSLYPYQHQRPTREGPLRPFLYLITSFWWNS